MFFGSMDYSDFLPYTVGRQKDPKGVGTWTPLSMCRTGFINHARAKLRNLTQFPAELFFHRFISLERMVFLKKKKKLHHSSHMRLIRRPMNNEGWNL
jgi:hypothetical protein